MSQSPLAERATKLLALFDDATIVYKKDINRVIETSSEGVQLLVGILDDWRFVVDDMGKAPIPLAVDEDNPTSLSQVDHVLHLAERLLACFIEAKSPILHPALEDVQNEIILKIRSVANDMRIVLGFYTPDNAQGINRAIYVEHVLAHNLTASKSAITQQKNRIAQIKTKRSTGKDKPATLWNRINPLTGRGCLIILFTVMAMYFFGAWMPKEAHEWITVFSKIYIWGLALIWFPTIFLSPFSNSGNVTAWLLYLMLWLVGAAIWTYGFIKGVLIASLLLIPFILLSQVNSTEIQRDPQSTLRYRTYRWGWLSMLIVGILITGEQIWVIGAAVWFVFTVIAQISFKFFRVTFDMIAAVDPEHENNAQTRRRMFYFSYIATVLAAIPGFLGRPSTDFVLNLYRDVGIIAFGLITILIGVQAIIPSISTWSGAATKSDLSPSDIREMKLYARHQDGLTGFMQIFFWVFLLSLIGTSILGLVVYDKFSINFSIPALLEPTPNVFDIFNPMKSFHFSAEATAVQGHNLFFIVFLSSFFYSLSVLYYLFMTTSALTLPIRDALKSVPVVIQRASLLDVSSDDQALLPKVIEILKNSYELNGNVISDLYLTISETKQILCSITLIEDFPNSSELEKKVFDALTAVFSLSEIHEASVGVFRSHAGRSNQIKLFNIQLDRSEYHFLKKDTEGMNLSYKMRQLGAHMVHYLLPESQVL